MMAFYLFVSDAHRYDECPWIAYILSIIFAGLRINFCCFKYDEADAEGFCKQHYSGSA